MKTILKWLAIVVVAILVLAVAGGLFLEAEFRPETRDPLVVAGGRGHLQGKVTESKGWMPFVLPPIAGATVTLTPGGQSAATDDEGYFSIPDVARGVYMVEITADGYEGATIDGVAINDGHATTLADEALFPEPDGPPVARLKLGGPVPFAKPPAAYPYNTSVYLDAADSENLSRTGIRFEFRDESGALLMNPYVPGEPLPTKKSGMPGTPPTLFIFQPPRAGVFDATVFLTNETGEQDSATVTVTAINTPPEAVPMIIAGPTPPRKIPVRDARASSGLNVVRAGADVYLMGLGLDRNSAAPELFNTAGIAPDAYGKNHDHFQRQFDFDWQLFYIDAQTGERTALDDALTRPDDDPNAGDQIVSFRAEQPGRYEARLRVADTDPYEPLTGPPAAIEILAVDDADHQDGSDCADCHASQVEKYERTMHHAAKVGCENCHGPAAAHLAIAPGVDDYERLKNATQDVNYDAGVCGQCHDEYNEWEKSRHADGQPYGYHEVAAPLLLQCSRCHYARTFGVAVDTMLAADIEFHDVKYMTRIGGVGPQMPDLSKVPGKNEAGITCLACHNPHDAVGGESVGLRTGDAGALCQTCHEDKWQNAVLEGTAGEVQNGYEYPDEDYDVRNVHNTKQKCVLCHLADRNDGADANGVRAVGGHTLRMRDAGANRIVGGFGPSADDAGRDKNPAETDDVLNLAACADCHGPADTFDLNGLQTDVHARWTVLGDLLKSANDGVLPDVKAGDKCATCHRGGTMPFDEDPALVLENAYTNYKLVTNDRSWGIHNPRYVRKLLEDSIASVESYLATHGSTD
ncbi:MAG: carboxypeptidase regulatory-like domain-containing protein [Gammaproteobacteria bacterium]